MRLAQYNFIQNGYYIFLCKTSAIVYVVLNAKTSMKSTCLVFLSTNLCVWLDIRVNTNPHMWSYTRLVQRYEMCVLYHEIMVCHEKGV